MRSSYRSWRGYEPRPFMYEADILTLWVVMSLCVTEIRLLLIVTCHMDFDLLFSAIIDPCFHSAVNGEQPTVTTRAPPTFAIKTALKCQYHVVPCLPTHRWLYQINKEPDLFNGIKSFIHSTSCEFERYANWQNAYLERESFMSIRCIFQY
jgi:hypothetical protein